MKTIHPSTHLSNFLAELHCLWPLCNYTQYYDKLAEHGIFCVDSLLKLDATFFSDIIRIPTPTVHTFLAYVKKVKKRAKKGKAPLCHIKREDGTSEICHSVDNNKEKDKENLKDWLF